MNQSTLKAALALIFQRWPFPPESDEHQKSYVARIRLAVSSWDRKREDGFKKAVDSLVGAKGQYGRPSPEQIVELSLARCGEGGLPAVPSSPADEMRAREERNRAQEREWERQRADPELCASAIRRIMRGARLWHAGSHARIHVAEWLRDFWGHEFRAGEFEEFVGQKAVAMAGLSDKDIGSTEEDRRRRAESRPPRPSREPGEEG